MHYQINVTQAIPGLNPEVAPPSPAQNDLADVLKQILEVNREQANLLRSMMAAQDQSSRWRAFLSRWVQSLPELGENCRQALPVLENVFAKSIHEITERIALEGEDLAEEFTLQEFLDRYGNRITQLATMMNMLGPLAEAAPSKATPPPGKA